MPIVVAFGILALVAGGMWGFGQWRWEVLTAERIAGIEARRSPPVPPDEAELAALPEPVQRFLRFAVPGPSRAVEAVWLEHDGTFGMAETGPQRWVPFRSRQRVVTHRPGLVWDGRVAMAPGLTVHVHDAYVGGEGILHPALLGLVTLAELRDRDALARGELMRFLAEAAWYPTALLPGNGLRWEAVDERSARAVLRDGAHEVSLTFTFGDEGGIETVRAEARGRTVNGQTVMTPWIGRFWDHQDRDGLRVPVQGEVAWETPEGLRPYWRGTLRAVRYERGA